MRPASSGQRFIQMLEHHPWFEVCWLAASDRSEGRRYAEAARWRLKTAIPGQRRAHDRVPGQARRGSEDYLRCARCRDRPRTGAAIRRGRMRRRLQLQRSSHAGRRAAGDSGSQRRPHPADRNPDPGGAPAAALWSPIRTAPPSDSFWRSLHCTPDSDWKP